MIKNRFLILLGLLIFIASSCEDYLDRQPLTEYSETTLWTGENDAVAACNACYSNFEDGQWVIYMDVASDNAHNPYPWEGWQEFGNMQLLTPNSWRLSTKFSFRTITKCNWFLENIDKAPIDETLLARMKGEVRFIRAYEYFQRSQLFGDYPLITKMLTTEEANAVSRTPKAEVVQFILSELEEIIPLLPKTYEGSNLVVLPKELHGH